MEKVTESLDRKIWKARERSGYDRQTVAQWIATEKQMRKYASPAQRRYIRYEYLRKRGRIKVIQEKCRLFFGYA